MNGAFDLTGKVVVLTGGNTGIGAGFARALAGAGAQVAIWGRNAERNEVVAAQVGGTGFVVDVTDEGAVVDAMAATVERFGRLDACFANASGLGPSSASFVDSTLEEWRAVTALFLDSVYLTLREAAKVMVAQGTGGSLVATSSVSARYGSGSGSHAYGAAKAAVITLVKGLAVDFGRQGIRANCILPAWVDSDMMAGINANPAVAENIRRRIPMRRWGDPDELGAIAVYLASDGSTWHTGDELVLDGGFSVY